MRREGECAEDLCKSGVADIEPARVSPEGRHHQACPVTDEAAPRQGAAAPADARHRMQMAGDFARACLRYRLVAKPQWPETERRGKNAAKVTSGIRVVIASDPDPVAAALKLHELGTIGCGKARRPVLIMKTVSSATTVRTA
jgi:hypothetical protein